MGFLDFLFGGSDKPQSDKTYEHAVLGEMYMDTDTSWFAEDATIPVSENVVSVSLQGNDDAPHQSALDGFDWLMKNFEAVKEKAQGDFFELYENYTDEVESPVTVSSPGAIWDTANLLSLNVVSKDEFDLSVTFDWQDPKDDHEITIYFEDGVPSSTSVDG